MSGLQFRTPATVCGILPASSNQVRRSCDATRVQPSVRLHRFIQQFAIIAVVFLFAPRIAQANSDSASVKAAVSTTSVRVAEPLTLELSVTAESGSTVDFPSVGESLGSFDVTDQVVHSDIPLTDNNRLRMWTWRLTLESIVTGELEIPAMEIRVRHGTESQTLKTKTISISVVSVLEDRADLTKFHDIHSVVDIPESDATSRAWLWWTLGGAAGLASVLALMFVISKRKSMLTPRAWAIEELDKIRYSRAMQSGNSELVTQDLSLALRDYLELQFQISAPVQTTNELLQRIRSGHFMSEAQVEQFKTLLETSDLVQFAGLQLSQAELIQSIERAVELVESTTHALQSDSPAAPSLPSRSQEGH